MGHLSFNGLESHGFHKVEVGVSGKSTEDPKEGLFVLIVRLGRDVKVLQIALAMEGDLAGLDFSVFLIDFVSDEDDWDVIADSGEILIPFGNIFVCDSGGDIEHDDGGVGSDVVSFSESS